MKKPGIARGRATYYASLGVASAGLAAGYGLAGVWWGIPVIVLVAIVWLWGDQRSWAWVGSLGFALYVFIAAIGMLLSVSPVWAIVAIATGLVAWDIGRFNRQLAGIKWIDKANLIERQYRKRLLSVTTLGAIVALVSTQIQFNFGFGVALFLGLVSIIGFSRAMSYLRQESN